MTDLELIQSLKAKAEQANSSLLKHAPMADRKRIRGRLTKACSPDAILRLLALVEQGTLRECVYTVDEDGTPHGACGTTYVLLGPFCPQCGGRARRSPEERGEG